jgi:hypothetical protein
VFGDRASGAYLHRFAWTNIVRHQIVTGRSSPDDPALTEYWAARRRKTRCRSTAPTNGSTEPKMGAATPATGSSPPSRTARKPRQTGNAGWSPNRTAIKMITVAHRRHDGHRRNPPDPHRLPQPQPPSTSAPQDANRARLSRIHYGRTRSRKISEPRAAVDERYVNPAAVPHERDEFVARVACGTSHGLREGATSASEGWRMP